MDKEFDKTLPAREELDPALFEKLEESEKDSEFIAVEAKTYLQDAWRCFKKNKLALFGLIFLILITLAAIIIPMEPM